MSGKVWGGDARVQDTRVNDAGGEGCFGKGYWDMGERG